MSREHIRINRFGFGEYERDAVAVASGIDSEALVAVLTSIVESVLSEEDGLLESLTDEAQADFVVPLGMCAKMLIGGDYSEVELISAAATVRFCADPHVEGFPDSLAQMILKLPR
ncbi:hypothetical protein [Actinoplanes rectilineatus]|uniref:hypothetical protein n=1 Tax=Actinoplanes rectilineatus TaxID=113571 RepID=UPI0005F2C5F5|nr:hypothetical protein [Actinoplanes rectilineatus]